MGFTPGSHFGPFVVGDLIGRGGMGQVYRARDVRLKREVALKTLAERVSSDATTVARFQREAEILAGLNHARIAALYGLEEHDGVRALVMELVEGETLAERIGGRPMALDDVRALAEEIVDALDYAHQRGVLHRDLKPSNIKLDAGGHLKILDFGLAKALDPSGSDVGRLIDDNSPTLTSPAITNTGIILGTAAYMAPEQVRGQGLDRRADVWAFGCVLYEMLTGTRAFVGETVSDTLAAVLTTDPDWTRLPARVPRAVGELVRRCLARDPKERLRDIADARWFLRAADASIEAPDVASAWGWRGVAAGAITAALLGVAIWSAVGATATPANPTVRHLAVQLAEPLAAAYSTGRGSFLAMAADGSALAYTVRGATSRLLVHRLTDGRTFEVRTPPNASLAAFSPDGRAVALWTPAGVWRSDVEGGEPELLCSTSGLDGFNGFRGGSWSADGRIVLGSTLGLLQVGRIGETCELLVPRRPDTEARFLWPQVLPGDRGILATVSDVSDDADSASLVVVRPGSDERRVIVRRARAGRVTPSGHLVFARGTQILAAGFDLATLELAGEPAVVADGVASGLFGAPLVAVSDAGDLAYLPAATTGNRLVWVARDGSRSDAGMPRRAFQEDPYLSPDGRHVAVDIGTGDHYLWTYSFETGTLAPLVSGRDVHQPVWRPDSRALAVPFYGQGIALKQLDSAGDAELVVPDTNNELSLWAWSPDGRLLLASRRSAAGGFELNAVDIRDTSTATLIRSTSNAFGARFSPDGRWVAYAVADSGRSEVYVTDFPAARLKLPVSTDGGFAPAWRRDGREIYYMNGTAMMAATVTPGDPPRFGRPAPLFDGLQSSGAFTPYAVAPDGRFLFVEEGQDDAAQRRTVTLVLNWFEALRQQLGAR